MAAFILILDARWRWEVRFTPRFLCPRLKFLRYSLKRKFTRNRSRSGPFTGRINLLLQPEADTQFLCLPRHCLVITQTKLYWLQINLRSNTVRIRKLVFDIGKLLEQLAALMWKIYISLISVVCLTDCQFCVEMFHMCPLRFATMLWPFRECVLEIRIISLKILAVLIF
jgi:hypothetical protein